ncbi:MAG: hypothetical protein KDA37_06060 [Planctomycetales bacterium]|nr:hypothetical protein [Planctomycetales bacterium]
MSRFEFRLASRDDDSDLRRLLSSCPMDGGLAVLLCREPSYFDAVEIDGETVQIVTVRDRDTQELIGMGSRAIQRRFVAGVPCNVGYLSGLRLLPEYHGRAGLLARGYRMFRELHDDGLARFYLTTIAASNVSAISLLTSGRAPLPTYRDAGLFYTYAAPPVTSTREASTVAIRTAELSDAPLIIDFLNDVASQREFSPVYALDELQSGAGRLHGLSIDSVLIAEVDGRLVGTLALWDQRSFKQSVVASYPWWLSWTRPLYNIVARRFGTTTLPAVGAPIDSRFAALFAVADDDIKAATALVNAGQQMLGRQGGSVLLFGMHELDPLLPVLTRMKARQYLTRLYLVHWDDYEPPSLRRWPAAPYLEIARL